MQEGSEGPVLVGTDGGGVSADLEPAFEVSKHVDDQLRARDGRLEAGVSEKFFAGFGEVWADFGGVSDVVHYLEPAQQADI